MMTTRGGAELQRLIFGENVVVTDGLSEDLNKLKVRCRELAAGERARRLGFVTVEETISVRKGRTN
jgi:hypothetical protein